MKSKIGSTQTLLGVFAFLLFCTLRLSAQVTANPGLAIFKTPGTIVFTITVPSGTTIASTSVLTLGAPNLDFTAVPAGTTCPNVVSGSCKVEVQFQPTAPGRRQGAVVLSDPGGNALLSISLDAAGTEPLVGFGPTISTFAGRGTGGDGGQATSALLSGPTGITVDGFGNHYIADPKANKVRKVTPAGVISTFAGTGTAGFAGDGGPATNAMLSGPMAVLVDGAGFVYITDTGNNVVRMVDTRGIISTYAGQHYAPGTTPPAVCAAATNSVGDGCLGNQIVLNMPVDLVFCHAQNIHISDKLNNRVRTIMRIGYNTITQVGNGVAGYNGDGELNTDAELNGPTGMAMDAANYIYVADSGNHIIRKTLLSGTVPNPISTVAGTPGSAGNSGDGGPAINAQLNNPHGVQVDPAGDIYISDSDSHVVRKVNIDDKTISTVVGTGTAGFGGDAGPAVAGQLNAPADILVDDFGNLYIADANNSAIRKVDVSDAPTLTFANTPVGQTSASQSVSVTNLGSAPLTLDAISAPTNYSLAGSTCNLASGQTLAPGTTCLLGIAFTPGSSGSLNGSLTLTDNGNPKTQVISLNGVSGALNQTYTVAAKTAAMSVPAGSNGTDTITLTSANFAGTVTFTTSVTSSDGTPADVTAAASPVTLTPGGTATSTVTITANASAANHSPASPWNGGTGGTLMFCAALIGAPFAFRRKPLIGMLGFVLAISLSGLVAGCGGAVASSNNQPHTQAARTYTVTVTPIASAASGITVTNPTPVTLTVTVK